MGIKITRQKLYQQFLFGIIIFVCFNTISIDFSKYHTFTIFLDKRLLLSFCSESSEDYEDSVDEDESPFEDNEGKNCETSSPLHFKLFSCSSVSAVVLSESTCLLTMYPLMLNAVVGNMT